MTTEYVSPADTARLIRQALARALPGVRFYVRTRAGGTSINVYYDGIDHWTENLDGPPPWHIPTYRPGMPTREDVQAIAGPYAGGDFDGMIDLAYSVYRYLAPDGSVRGTDTDGTYGSHGSNPPCHDPQPIGTRRVRFLADYVFVNPELPYDVRCKRATL